MTSLQQQYKTLCTAENVKCNSAVVAALPTTASATAAFTTWDLTDKMIGTKGLRVVLQLVCESLPHLKVLRLCGNNLCSASTATLLTYLGTHASLETLDLSNNDIRLGGPELVDLVKRSKSIKELGLDRTYLRPLFVRLMDIALKKRGGVLLGGGAADSAAPPSPVAVGRNKSGGGRNSGTKVIGFKFEEEPSNDRKRPSNSEDHDQDQDDSNSGGGGRFSFGEAAADHDDGFAAAEADAFANFQHAVHFDTSAAGGKKVPRRPTVCSEVYKEEEIDNFVPEVIEKEPKIRQYLLTTLESHDLFSHLEDYELSVAVDAFYERQNSKGDLLYEEGDESDTFYILASGKVELSLNGEPIETKKKGATLQDLMLLYPGNSKETVTCLEDVTVYSLDRQTYRCIVSKASKKKRALYEGFLNGVGFLKAANLSKSEILSLADALKSATFEPSGSLIKYGEVGETFYIIVEGVVEVYGRDDEQHVIKVCEFTVGDCVGELEFLNNHKCVADVKAKGFVRVAKMNRHHFELVMGPVKDVLARNASENTVYEYYRHQLERMDQQGH